MSSFSAKDLLYGSKDFLEERRRARRLRTEAAARLNHLPPAQDIRITVIPAPGTNNRFHAEVSIDGDVEKIGGPSNRRWLGHEVGEYVRAAIKSTEK